MTDLFNLNNVDDLPPEMKKDVVSKKRDGVEEKIIGLFKLAQRELTIDEVYVGFYRKFGEQKARKYIMSKLYNMSRSDDAAIERVKGKKGVYSLKEGYTEL